MDPKHICHINENPYNSNKIVRMLELILSEPLTFEDDMDALPVMVQMECAMCYGPVFYDSRIHRVCRDCGLDHDGLKTDKITVTGSP